MTFVGIVGARKYRNRQSVEDLVVHLPMKTTIVTSSCRGVCTWAREAADKRGMDVAVYAPDLNNIRSNFEVAERYYQRNRELIEKCDLVHAFVTREKSCTGGTGYEVKYALKLGKTVKLHRENGISEFMYPKFPRHKGDEEMLHASWQNFFAMIFA